MEFEIKMTPEEDLKHRLEGGMPFFCKYNSFIIAFAPAYNKRLGNDFLKPRYVLVYDTKHHYVFFTQFNVRTMRLMLDDTTKKIIIKDIKDQKTFENFVNNKLNPYCREHNCDYNNFINDYEVNQCKEDNIFIESPTNPNQKIIYHKTNKLICFLEVYGDSKPVTNEVFRPGETCDNFINENNFAEFTEESFEFCKENGCSFADYANEIVPKILQLKNSISKYAKEIKAELCYTTFDKNVKTAFAYYNNGITGVFKVIDDKQIFPVSMEFPWPINSREEFKTLIKNNRTIIDKTVNECLEKVRQQNELERLMNANSKFRSNSRGR